MYTAEYYSAIKKNETMPFAPTQMSLEMITLNHSERERQIPYDVTYMWNLKYDTNEVVQSLSNHQWHFSQKQNQKKKL